VLDTNVLISAIVFGGKPRNILERIIKGKIRLAVSESILQEVKAVLDGNKFQYPPQLTHTIISEIEAVSELVKPKKSIKAVGKDPDDNKFLECALEAGAHFIITGDMHLLELEIYKGVRIMNPADFLREMLKE
jgi:hypothetical protein